MHLSRLVPAAGLGIVLTLGSLTLGARPSRAADDAVALVTQVCDKTLTIISDPRISAADRERRLRVLVDNYFDVPGIARFVLGRYWPTASEDERSQFIVAFENHLVHAYAVRLGAYSGEKFRVLAPRVESASVTIVPVEILRAESQTPVVLTWKLEVTLASLLIRDVGIAGVSLAVTYRDEFASVIQRSNGQVAGLIAALRAKAAEQAEQ